MPTVTSGRVLVTGANGYLAAWAVRTLLQQGYSVRGIVRSTSSQTVVNQLFAKFGSAFEAEIVPDYIKVSTSAVVASGIDL